MAGVPHAGASFQAITDAAYKDRPRGIEHHQGRLPFSDGGASGMMPANERPHHGTRES